MSTAESSRVGGKDPRAALLLQMGVSGEDRTTTREPSGLRGISGEKNSEALSKKAFHLYEQGDCVRALELVDFALTQDPQTGYLHFNRGVLLLDMGDKTGAAAAFQQALDRGMKEAGPILAKLRKRPRPDTEGKAQSLAPEPEVRAIFQTLESGDPDGVLRKLAEEKAVLDDGNLYRLVYHGAVSGQSERFRETLYRVCVAREARVRLAGAILAVGIMLSRTGENPEQVERFWHAWQPLFGEDSIFPKRILRAAVSGVLPSVLRNLP